MPILQAARAAAPGIGSRSVADAQGIIRHSTVPLIIGQSRADTYLSRTLGADSGLDALVDEPFPNPRYEGQYVLPFGRRLEAADGTFDGVVVAVILPSAFDEFFETIDTGVDGVIWVLHPNGVILSRDPSKRVEPSS